MWIRLNLPSFGNLMLMGHMSGKKMDNFTFESDIGYIDACGISLNGAGSDSANVGEVFRTANVRPQT